MRLDENARVEWKRSRVWCLAGLLLLVMAATVVSTIRQQSLTWDEGDHIFAGYMTWKTGDYGLNPEHPPMVKMLATVPLLGLPLKVPPLQGRNFKTEAYMDGRDLLFGNGPAYGPDTLIFRVRVMAGVFALLLGVWVLLAGWEMFGPGAGLLALTLYCFEPNLLAHAAYVTTDMAVSCMLFGAVYLFYRYVKAPGWGRLVAAGVVSGLALAAKHSAVLLLPMLVLLMLSEVVFAERGARRQVALRLAGGLAVIVVVGVVVLWGFYGFRYAARPAGLRLDPTLAQYVMPLRPSEARLILFLGRWHVLPESFLYGLADVRAMANNMPSYLFGMLYAHGVWYYFPAVFLIKSTLGFLGLLGLAVFASARGWLGHRREVLFLTVPPLFYLAIAMESSLNIGARHILPLYVFFAVLAAGGAAGCSLEVGGGSAGGAACGVVAAGTAELHGLFERAMGRPDEDVPVPDGLEHGLGAAVEGGEGVCGSAWHQGVLDGVFRVAVCAAVGLRDSVQAAADAGHVVQRAAGAGAARDPWAGVDQRGKSERI